MSFRRLRCFGSAVTGLALIVGLTAGSDLSVGQTAKETVAFLMYETEGNEMPWPLFMLGARTPIGEAPEEEKQKAKIVADIVDKAPIKRDAPYVRRKERAVQHLSTLCGKAF